MRTHMLVLLMIAGTAMAQQTGGGGAPGPTQGGGGGAPTGSAGGALTGSYPSPGLNPSAAVIPSPSGSQSIVQPGGTTLQLNNLLVSPINNVVYVDGVNGAGIGVGQSAWSSSTAYPQCTAVSYSGGNYLGVAASTNVTPGTNSAIWYAVPNGATPTQLDCAFYTAASKVGAGAGAAMRLGPGTYLSNIGLVEPTVTAPGSPIVNIYGQGRAVTTIKLNTNNGDGFPFLYLPKTSVNYAFASFNWEDFTVDANYNSTGAVGIYGAQQYTLKDMTVADAADGSDHEIEFGDATDTLHGWTFEPDIENVDLGTFRGFGTGAYASATVTGGVPSFTIVNGGSGYSSADTQVILGGTSDFGRACSNAGTTTATINGSGVVTAITSTATGCVAPLYPIIYGGPNINYGYKFSNTTDAKKITNMTNGGVGWIAGMYIADTDTALKIYNYHPEAVLQGALILGSADFYSSQCDTVFQYCFNIQGAGTVNFHSPFFEWNNPNMTGSRDYLFLNQGSGVPGFNQPQAVNIENETCGNFPEQAGYYHFDSTAGSIDDGGSGATLPAYVHAVHPQYCNQIGNGHSVQNASPTLVGSSIQMGPGATGNVFNFTPGSGPVTGATQTMSVTSPGNTGAPGIYNWQWGNSNPATSATNFSSPYMEFQGNYWNGSGSAPDVWYWQGALGSGPNPTSTMTLGHAGSPGVASVLFNVPVALGNGSTATTQSTGDNTTKVASDAFVQTALGGPLKVVNGVSYSSAYSGSTLDVRVNSCIIDAETLANGNTSGICDSSGEGGTQSIAAPIIVGDSSLQSVTWKLPSTCAWTASGFTSSSTSAVITQHAGSTILGPVNSWTQCVITDTNAFIGAVYQTVEQGYYRAEGFLLYNGGYTVAEGASMVVNGAIDTSSWRYIGVLHQAAASAAMRVVGSSSTGSICCASTFDHIQANSNNQGGIVLDIEGSSAGEPISISFSHSTFTHPKTGQPAILCNDTATTKSSQVNFFDTYIETGNTDTTTALIQNTGCGQLLFHGLNITDPSTASTATAITNSNAFGTSISVEGLTQYAGFTQPATAIVNNFTGEAKQTDAYGHLSSYQSGPNYTTTLNVTTQATAAGFFPQSKAAGPYSVLFDDYYSGANTAPNNIGTPTGASCAVNTTYTDMNHPGNLLLTSGTGGTGTGITCGYQSEFPSVLSPNSGSPGWTWETAVYVPVLPSTTAGAFQAGLTSGANANPWTTGIQFYLSSANSVANDWYCRYSSTSTDSTIAAAAATWTRLTMVNDGTYVHWYINGTEATSCKTAVGSMPSGAQYPASWSAMALSASSVTMAVDYVDFQRATAR
jgi:hypothetical protein